MLERFPVRWNLIWMGIVSGTMITATIDRRTTSRGVPRSHRICRRCPRRCSQTRTPRRGPGVSRGRVSNQRAFSYNEERAAHLETFLVGEGLPVESCDAHAAVADGRHGSLSNLAHREGHIVVE